MPTEDAYSSGHLVLSHFGTCKCSNVETNISWTFLVSGLLSFEHPSVLLFLLLSRNSKYKLRNSGVLWSLLLLYFPLTSHSIIGSSVSMSIKHKPLHWYCTLLSENPSFSYTSPLVNQKPLCHFKSKYPVNMTDEEWLQFLEKSFMFWSSSLPPYVHLVEGKGGCTFSTVKCLLLVVILQFFLCGFNFSCSWRHCTQLSQIRGWSARNDATSDNWVLTIIKCPPECAAMLRRRQKIAFKTGRKEDSKQIKFTCCSMKCIDVI